MADWGEWVKKRLGWIHGCVICTVTLRWVLDLMPVTVFMNNKGLHICVLILMSPGQFLGFFSLFVCLFSGAKGYIVMPITEVENRRARFVL